MSRSFLLRLVLVVTSACILIPLSLLLLWSFADRWHFPNLLPLGLSSRGMQELFGGPSGALSVLGSSIALSMSAAAVTTLISVLAARAVVLYDFPGKRLLMFGSILPVIIPGTVFALGIHVVFLRWGWGDTFLGVMTAHCICALPYAFNIMTGVTRSVGNRLEEQAQVLGCCAPLSFIKVSLPLLMRGILSSFGMAYIISFSQYFLTLLLGGGRVKTLSVIMVPFIAGGDRTLASAYALLFVLSMALVFALIEIIIRRVARLDQRQEDKGT